MEKGALRQQVLWIVRRLGEATTGQVLEEVREAQDRNITVNTVQTVLNRLVDQGLLTRTGGRRHYIYRAEPSQDAVKERASRAAADLLAESGDQGLVHFLDTMDKLQPDAIAKLERLLAERRAGHSQSDDPQTFPRDARERRTTKDGES